MRWQDFRRSENVEDRGSAGGGGFMGGGLKLSGGGIIVVVVVSLLMGKNPLELLGMLEGGGAPPSIQAPGATRSPANDENTDFVRAVVGDIEDTWTMIFRQKGAQYQPPKINLFSGRVNSACGAASAAMGPFYCPADHDVYLDLSFFRELHQRFGAPGDFARAYVIAHEVGHHVQNLLGVDKQTRERMSRLPERSRNDLLIRQELQADCFAGVWGFYAKQRGALDPTDLEQGFRAAAAIGDDRLQKQTQGYIVPESFTHGTSAQRVRWFRIGLESGDPAGCNTFAAREP